MALRMSTALITLFVTSNRSMTVTAEIAGRRSALFENDMKPLSSNHVAHDLALDVRGEAM
jgi:hypothetical protein